MMWRDEVRGGRGMWRDARVGIVILCMLPLAALVLLAGCGSSEPAAAEEDVSRRNLQRIGLAYSEVSGKLNRPPRNMRELSAAIEEGPDQVSAAEVLKSPNDGEDYVVVLGVDFAEVAKARGNVDVVIAYEKSGKDGRRYVLKPPAFVEVMSDEEFKSAAFPPGHQPAP